MSFLFVPQETMRLHTDKGTKNWRCEQAFQQLVDRRITEMCDIDRHVFQRGLLFEDNGKSEIARLHQQIDRIKREPSLLGESLDVLRAEASESIGDILDNIEQRLVKLIQKRARQSAEGREHQTRLFPVY